jgi:NADPH:quinone reductase-like Zn-dependent oxidoreductase
MIGLGVRTADGPVEVLSLPTPRDPRAGELLLDVLVAGIGPWDALLPTGGWEVGLQLPAALGVEAVGRVAALGPDVTGFGAGDLVLVHDAPLPGRSGTWAEQVLVHAASAAPCPPELSPQVAAGLPVAALTARQALDQLQVGPATRLLVVGASGPTAALSVQLASRAGATVVAAAGPAHADRLRGFGANEVIDSHDDGWSHRTGHRFDAVLIAAPGTAEDAMTLVQDGGRLCSILSDAPAPERDITTTNLYVRPDAGQLADLAVLAAQENLTLEIHPVTIEDGPAIAQQVATGHSGGRKYVLEL